MQAAGFSSVMIVVNSIIVIAKLILKIAWRLGWICMIDLWMACSLLLYVKVWTKCTDMWQDRHALREVMVLISQLL